jgi:DHA1 family tetracycline resistance protein-like MFS transporter
MPIVFLVVFLDIVGFSIIIPIFVYYAMGLGATREMATAMLAIYPAAMLIASPILGRLSDRHGRKPLMLVSLLGAVAGYLLLGFAGSLWVVGLARAVQGAMAGNIAVAQAYMADITEDKDRAKGMGIIGAAIGLGFVLGPSIGSYLGGESFENANLFLPAMTSAVVSSLAFLSVLFLLPESLDEAHKEAARNKPAQNPIKGLGLLLGRPILAELILCGLIFNIAAGLVEAIFPIWAMDRGIIEGPRGMMLIFLCAGLMLAFMQGGVIGRLTPIFGEHKLLMIGASVYGIGVILVSIAGDAQSYVAVVAAMTVQAGAMAFIITPLQSLVSQRADPSEQGIVMGVYSSVGTLGRVIGPLLTGAIYSGIHHNAPYYGAAVLSLLLLLLAVFLKRRW